jgi:Tfp pilus assembly protein PilF
MGHHATNIATHALNSILLFLLFLRASGRLGRSILVAALFVLHPLNVESVAWIAERKNVLSMFLFLLALGAYGWFAKQSGIWRYLVVAFLFLLGLAAKPMVITLPFVLLLLDFWPLQRIKNWSAPAASFPFPQFSPGRLIVEKLPLLILSALSAALTITAQRPALVTLPLRVRVENAVYSYAVYVGKAFWPNPLAALYPHPKYALSVWQIGLAVVCLGIVSFGVWKQRFARPYLSVGWLWFLGTLVPVVGIVQVGLQAMADRYAYLPFIGLFAMVVWGAADLADHFRIGTRVRAIPIALVLIVLAGLARRQLGYWRSDYDLWTHALQVTQNNSVAEDQLGVALVKLDRREDGFAHFQNVARLDPRDANCHINIGAYFGDHGRPQEAVSEYEKAISLTNDPDLLATAFENLGVTFTQLGDLPRAIENYEQSLKVKPDQTEVHAAVQRLELAERIRQLARSTAAQPTGTGLLELGNLFRQTGDLAQASIAYREALRLDPNLTEAQQAILALPVSTP